ncbi:GNAT family N-acetyltransferase [Corynebacterium lowii]|uniref:Lysine N-acyltransferase MbtK n=1 Tax=Corynebacterium lowii TaxID=1544413 RepID=A0A0Q1DV08_9CORY|nr:GNAT family N-acetyltransferase [Corynebacterium lowii]KQB83983.1 Lysine N-acyltransferase MbtK [Corynebacterium lowii]MDP9852767.1 RimJ/RimL family protein N-acetyltransferase [Corynebacterium lowii]
MTAHTDPSAVLHRLRTDVAPATVLPHPPRLPELPGRYQVRVATPEDAALISEWMNRPHLASTWEQPWKEERWRADIAARLSGTYSTPVILSVADHQPPKVGYLEVYYPARDDISYCFPSAPTDLGLHIAIGLEELTGRGFFQPFFEELPGALLRANPGSERIIAEPDHRNTRIHSMLRKTGWSDLGEYQHRPTRRVRIFEYRG